MATTELTGIAGWAVSVMEAVGVPGVGLLIAAENLFPPIPSEVILPLAGFTASQGSFTVIGAIIWATIGSAVGALALYLLGAWLGRDRFRALWARLPLVDLHDLDRTEAWFDRHGGKAIFFGRFLPIFRSLISIPAGIERTPLLLFAVLTTLGSAIWNTIFILAGYQLGEQWHRVEGYVGTFQNIVIVVVALAVLWFVVRRIRRNRAAA